MELRQLRTFIEVAECGSLTHAAERLHMVQPTLSRQIKLLEDEFGLALFERQSRGMKPTEAGQRLLERGRAILREVEHTRTNLLELSGTVVGSVVCGVIPSLGERALVPYVRSFAEANPLVSLRLGSGYAGFLVDWLARRQIDVALLYDMPGLASHDAVRLVEEPLLAVAAPEVGLDMETLVELRALANVPLILPSPLHGLRQLVEASAQRNTVQLKVRIEADSLQMQLELAKSGFGWTILPSSAVAYDILQQRVSAAPVCRPEILRRIILARPTDRSQSSAVRHFADGLARYLLSTIDDGLWLGARPISQ